MRQGSSSALPAWPQAVFRGGVARPPFESLVQSRRVVISDEVGDFVDTDVLPLQVHEGEIPTNLLEQPTVRHALLMEPTPKCARRRSGPRPGDFSRTPALACAGPAGAGDQRLGQHRLAGQRFVDLVRGPSGGAVTAGDPTTKRPWDATVASASSVCRLATRDLRAAARAKANVVELLEEERARKLVVGGQSHIAPLCPVRLVGAEEKAAVAARNLGARGGRPSV
jgi:hypothetical protein